MRSFEVESVEKVGNDYALDVKVTANRLTDAAGHFGLAREIAAITNVPYKERKITSPDTAKNFSICIRIVPTELCLRYAGRMLDIPKNGASPRWLQDRLIVCGLRPINAIVDVTNYVMRETGHPLHAFDANAIIGKEILVRASKKGEEIITLDGTKRLLPEGAIVIQDRERIIDLAGIMGGQNSGISEGSTSILLQAAVFNSARVYSTSQSLGLSSAASKLYAAGMDPSASFDVLERATELLEKIAAAQRIGPAYDWYPQRAISPSILFHPDYADSIIGEANGFAFYQRTFTRLGFDVEKRAGDMIVEVPPRRQDIRIEEDLIEEAARLLGYEHITPRFPQVALTPGRRNDEVYWQEEIRDRLVGAGFSEAEVYEFTGNQELEQFSLAEGGACALEHPMSAEQSYLVPRLLIKFISLVKKNFKNRDTVKLFGIGKSFLKTEGGVDEKKDLIVAFGRKGEKGEDEFYQLKGVIDYLLESIGIEDYSYNEPKGGTSDNTGAIFHPHRRAEIKVGSQTIGVFGEIHPAVLERIKSKARIVAAELYFDRVWRCAHSEQEYRPVGKYPAVRRDIAVVIPSHVKTESVLNVIETAGKELLVDTDLFDYFQDNKMREAEEKSIAFHLVFESPERTLKDKEIDEAMKRITEALEDKEWEVRK